MTLLLEPVADAFVGVCIRRRGLIAERPRRDRGEGRPSRDIIDPDLPAERIDGQELVEHMDPLPEVCVLGLEPFDFTLIWRA